MKRIRIAALFLAAVLCLLAAPLPASARTPTKEETAAFEASASFLADLGLFRGVSDGNHDLFRPATRVEAAVMIVRLLGEEDAAVRAHYSHPFTDVPAWADDYVGYAYARGITGGVSPDRFGTDAVTAPQYVTFLLRVLGYSDASGDFAWDDPFPLAEQAGILTEDTAALCDLSSFRRAEMAYLSWSALTAVTKGDAWPLAAVLAEKRVFTSRQFIDATVRYRGSIRVRPENASLLQAVREPEEEIPPGAVREAPQGDAVSSGILLSPLWSDIAGIAEEGALIYFVNTDTGKIHLPSCRYCDRSKYDWPLAFTASPDALIASDPLTFSRCQVCGGGR